MPMYVQVCNDEVLEVFQNQEFDHSFLEHVKKDSQEWANLHETNVTVYEVVAEMSFEPEDENDLDSIEEDEDDDGVPA